MRKYFIGASLGLAMVILGGCGPSVPEDDLGEVVFDVPEVSGAEEPYQLPEVKPGENDGNEIRDEDVVGAVAD